MLPKEVRKKFSLSWEPIFRMMEQADGTNLDDDPMESFKIGYEYLKTRVGYVFRGKRMNLETWGGYLLVIKSSKEFYHEARDGRQ